MRWFLLVLLATSCAPLDIRGLRPDLYVRVTRVIDGDTIVTHEGTVRLIGVNTPETHHPTTPVQPCGPEAEAFTRAELTGKTVRLVLDGKDHYNRLLAYVYMDRNLFNLKLVEQGWSPAYDRYKHRLLADFRAAEVKARAAHRGLWNPRGCNAVRESSER